jgi:hypothetical protein
LTALDWERDIVEPLIGCLPRAGLTSTAFHEAGHAAVARALGVEVDLVSIRPSEGHLGVALHGTAGTSRDFDLGPWWEHPETVTSVGRTVAICLAGVAAEALVVPTDDVAGWDDRAASRAILAVARLSPEDHAALIESEGDAAPVDDGTVAWRLAEALTGSVGEAAAFLTLMRASTRRLVNEQAIEIAALARALLQTPVLDGRAVEGILAKENRWPPGSPSPATGHPSIPRSSAARMCRSVAGNDTRGITSRCKPHRTCSCRPIFHRRRSASPRRRTATPPLTRQRHRRIARRRRGSLCMSRSHSYPEPRWSAASSR